MTPPFSAVSKSCDPLSVSIPTPPLLISDKSPRVLNKKWIILKSKEKEKYVAPQRVY